MEGDGTSTYVSLCYQSITRKIKLHTWKSALLSWMSSLPVMPFCWKRALCSPIPIPSSHWCTSFVSQNSTSAHTTITTGTSSQLSWISLFHDVSCLPFPIFLTTVAACMVSSGISCAARSLWGGRLGEYRETCWFGRVISKVSEPRRNLWWACDYWEGRRWR